MNLFRITWKNEPVEYGGGFGRVNYLEFPKELTGVKARIFMLNAQWYDEDYWRSRFQRAEEWDEKIRVFNERVGI